MDKMESLSYFVPSHLCSACGYDATHTAKYVSVLRVTLNQGTKDDSYIQRTCSRCGF
mgnify:CR=1 FL=1